jgi:hypothetical protein
MQWISLASWPAAAAIARGCKRQASASAGRTSEPAHSEESECMTHKIPSEGPTDSLYAPRTRYERMYVPRAADACGV